LLEAALHRAPRCELPAAEACLREVLQEVVSRLERPSSAFDAQRQDDWAVADVINADLRLRGYQPLDRDDAVAEDGAVPDGHCSGEEDAAVQDTIAEELRRRAVGRVAGETEVDSVEVMPSSPQREGPAYLKCTEEEEGLRRQEGVVSSSQQFDNEQDEVDEASEDGDALIFGAQRVLVSIKATLAKGELPTAAELESFFDVDAMPDGEDMVAVDVAGLGPGFAEAPKQAAQAIVAQHGLAQAAKLIVSACEALDASDEEDAECDAQETSDARDAEDVQAGGEDGCERQS